MESCGSGNVAAATSGGNSWRKSNSARSLMIWLLMFWVSGLWNLFQATENKYL
ncbi:hypothetical protein OROMI_018761 [Orobanche minor]